MFIGEALAGMDKYNNIRLEIEIQGLYKKVPYGAIVDTGFSGSLVLPLVVAVDIGLTKAGAATVTLADGSTQTRPVFMCRVKLGDKVMDAETFVMGSEVLVGMGVLDEFAMCIAPASGNVVIQDSRAAVNYANLVDMLRKLTGRQPG